MVLEHDAKELLALDGIPVPKGMLTTTADVELPPTLAGPWMVKAQIPLGGRGKAGGVKLADDASRSLTKIVGSAAKSYEMATKISRALEDQSQASRHLHEVTSRMSDHIAEINRIGRAHV